jgi:hypothetical protein
MTLLILEIAGWMVAAFLAAAIVYFAMRLGTRLLRMRARELATARSALAEYDDAYATLVADPATPIILIELLTEFDRGVMDRGAAHFVARSIFRDRGDWLKSDPNHPVLVAMRNLTKHRPDLHDLFVRAVSRGFAATMLRWPVPAAALRFLIVDPASDPVTPARAVACGAEHEHPREPLPQAA